MLYLQERPGYSVPAPLSLLIAELSPCCVHAHKIKHLLMKKSISYKLLNSMEYKNVQTNYNYLSNKNMQFVTASKVFIYIFTYTCTTTLYSHKRKRTPTSKKTMTLTSLCMKQLKFSLNKSSSSQTGRTDLMKKEKGIKQEKKQYSKIPIEPINTNAVYLEV